MAEIKISELPVATTPLTGAELVELSQISGGSYGSVGATTEDIAFAASKYGSFHDLTDQTGSTSAATAVKLGTADINTKGITVVTDGSALTRITYAAAGTYMIAPSLQFENSDAADHDATVWFAKNGTAIASSATRVTIPKATDGGAAIFQIVYYAALAANDYLQVMWLPENASITLAHTAAGAIAPAVPSAIVVSERIGL